ncbi:hypothetical protein [Actinomadura sp. 9N215]|uniref:hypothetical protein n=1 Tax=Actinomadura sp. 9N215 TaxID=3375150 RepID=UPI003792B1FD
MSSRRKLNLDEPGLPEALAAYTALMDAVVTESQHLTRTEDDDLIAACSDVIDRAADRARRGGTR